MTRTAAAAGAVAIATLAAWAVARGAPATGTSAGAGASHPGSSGAGGGAGEAPKAATASETVKIIFRTTPPKHATVSWGKKKLGVINPKEPLVVERPRDSGPLDVIVRADGCLSVHTRATTFSDATINVKVTPVAQKNTIYGYREELPPEADGGTGTPVPDGGVPP